mgnify:CR=1 FL=1
MSFNKLDGVLDEGFAEPSNGTSINLIVNRLSGSIPSSLLEAQQIQMLQGNIFECESSGKLDERPDERSLPTHDNYASNYDCGSNAVNTALYIWAGCACGLMLLVLLMVLVLFGQPDEHSVRALLYCVWAAP